MFHLYLLRDTVELTQSAWGTLKPQLFHSLNQLNKYNTINTTSKQLKVTPSGKTKIHYEHAHADGYSILVCSTCNGKTTVHYTSIKLLPIKLQKSCLKVEKWWPLLEAYKTIRVWTSIHLFHKQIQEQTSDLQSSTNWHKEAPVAESFMDDVNDFSKTYCPLTALWPQHLQETNPYIPEMHHSSLQARYTIIFWHEYTYTQRGTQPPNAWDRCQTLNQSGQQSFDEHRYLLYFFLDPHGQGAFLLMFPSLLKFTEAAALQLRPIRASTFKHKADYYNQLSDHSHMSKEHILHLLHFSTSVPYISDLVWC